MVAILQCTDRRGRPVTLTEHCWLDHVVPARPWLLGLKSCVATVLSDPFRIYADAVHQHCECFYRQNVLPDRPHLFLKVVVEYDANDHGSVITVIPLRRLHKPGESQLWP